MRVTYNPELNIGYIQLRDALKEGEHVDTIQISDEMNIDMTPDGRIFGIELLNANEQLKSPEAMLVIENQQSHQIRELPL